MNIKKTAAVIWAVSAITAMAVSCAADNSEEYSESVFSESGTAEITETSISESGNDDDISELFTYRINEDSIRIVKYIGNDTAVVIPDFIEGLPVKQINTNIFFDRKVTELTLPAGAENISEKRLSYTKNLENIYISEGSEKYISVDGVIYTADGKTLVMYPGGRTGEAEIAKGTECIGDRAFYGCNIGSAVLPDTVEEIGVSAFEGCKGLTNIDIPGSVKEIGEYSFCGSGLERVTLNEGSQKIGRGAFESTKIMELYIPDSISEAGSYILGSERGAVISAAAPAEGLKPLDKYEKLSYRRETALESAVRTAGRMAEASDEYRRHRAYLADINGDDFPEMFLCNISKSSEEEYLQALYMYDSGECLWERVLDEHSSSVSIYRDKETGGYMEIDSGNFSETSDSFFGAYMKTEEGCFPVGESDFFYPINGYYSDNDGYMTFFESGGNFQIYEMNEAYGYDEKAFAEFIDSTVDKDRYELAGKIDVYGTLSELQSRFSDSEDRLIICGDFADLPDPEKADFAIPQRSENEYFYWYDTDFQITVEIAGRTYNEYSFNVYLDGDEVNRENFEKLALLPSLTSLHLSGRYDGSAVELDLTGIDGLKNLKRLCIGSWGNEDIRLTNTDCLKSMDIQWLRVTGNVENADFIGGLDKVRVLEIGNSLDKSDDYYSAVSRMDSLQYIPVSVFEINVTKEQEEKIKELRPDISFCYYKVG